jgi:hypothetical protein
MFNKIVCASLVGCLMVFSLVAPVQGESFFTVRRTFGVLFLSGSAILAKRSVDFRKDANSTFGQYEIASSARLADELFERTSDRDTKSQMAGGLSVVLLVSGLRLLASGVDGNIPKMDRRFRRDGKQVSVRLKSDVQTGQVGVAISKEF